ncbi:MAG: lipocalin family protein [Candidatus Obscuribacterales bacterium]|nr:lipocalin family protein [Candidatus Obscuribacterales bacterium]
MQNRLLFSALLTVMSLASSYCQAQGREVGEKVLVDVTGARKNWETATIRAKDAAGYKVEMLGVGKYVGEFYVPEAWFYDAASGSIPQAGVSYGTAGSGKVKEFAKVGDSVLVDVTGAKKNWETGKVIAKSGNMYTIRMLGVGDHKGEYQVPENWLFGAHKEENTAATSYASSRTSPGSAPHLANSAPQASSSERLSNADPKQSIWANSSSSSSSNRSSSSSAGASSNSSTSDSWKWMQADIDARIKQSQNNAATQSNAKNGGSDSWKWMQADIEARIKGTQNQSKVNAGPAKPVAGSKGLSGLYLRHEQTWMGTSLNYREEHYYFMPDGRFYKGVPPEGPSAFNWAKVQSEHPELCGQYGINGDKITLSYGGEAPYSWLLKMKNAENMEMNYAPTNKVEKFGNNARISGTFARGTVFAGNYSYTGAPTITAAGTYTFSADGTVTTDSTTGIDGDTKVSGVTVGLHGGNRGTYTINGNDLTLNLGGQSKRCTVYPISKNGNILRISIDGALYEKRKY